MGEKLGQHFLKSRGILKSVVSSISVQGIKMIVEIGPGKGALTKEILSLGIPLLAIEKDIDLVKKLDIQDDNLTIINTDVRNVSWMKGISPYAVFSNLPFYLTGSIIKKLLTSSTPPACMSLIVQKEVGQRIAKKNKKESILSLSIQFYGNTKYIKTIPKRYFSPMPRVDSAIITITDIKKQNKKLSEVYFSLIKTAFHSKRKTVLKKFNKNIQNILIKNKIDNLTRAEDISFDIWLNISKEINKAGLQFHKQD